MQIFVDYSKMMMNGRSAFLNRPRYFVRRTYYSSDDDMRNPSCLSNDPFVGWVVIFLLSIHILDYCFSRVMPNNI